MGPALHPSTLFIPSPTHLATRPHCGNMVSMMLAVKATLSRRRDLNSTCFVCRRRDLWLALARQARLVKQRCPLKKSFWQGKHPLAQNLPGRQSSAPGAA